MDPSAKVMPDGKPLAGFRGRPRDVRAHLAHGGGQGTITCEVSFGKDPKVARALVKMGAEYFCYAQGRSLACDVITGPVAQFVRTGKGDRPLILAPADTSYRHWFGQIHRVGDNGWYCIFRLAHFEILIDLSPHVTVFETMARQMFAEHGGTGWGTLPPNAFRADPPEPIP